jgi:hypothetical protein
MRGGAPGVVMGGRVRAPVRFPGGGQAPVGAISHPFAAQGGMECCDSGGRLGSIRRGDLARGGGHDLSDPRPTAVEEDHALVRCRQRICPSRSP